MEDRELASSMILRHILAKWIVRREVVGTRTAQGKYSNSCFVYFELRCLEETANRTSPPVEKLYHKTMGYEVLSSCFHHIIISLNVIFPTWKTITCGHAMLFHGNKYFGFSASKFHEGYTYYRHSCN